MTGKKDSKNDLSLVIVTCDSYSDVLEQLLRKLNEIDFFDLGFKKIIVATDHYSQKLDVDKYGINQVVEGEAWGERLRSALKIVETERCIVLLDDYIPTSSVDTGEMKKVLNALNIDDDCVYLTSVFKQLQNAKAALMSGYVELPRSMLYRVNSTAAIWKVSSLLTVLKDSDSPWAWEAFAGFSNHAARMKLYAPIDDESQVYSYSYKTGGAVYRGCWVYSSLKSSGMTDEEIGCLKDRPIIYELDSSKRPLSWKLRFLLQGYKMIGLKVMQFIYYSLKKKFGIL